MKGKLIIVDDEPIIRKGLAKMIQASPVQWIIAGEAENGVEALTLIAETDPDLVIVDIRMPVMDGLELCSRIAELDRSMDVIVLTAHKDFEFAQAAVRFGAIDFLLKPCSVEELTQSLEKAFRSYSSRQDDCGRQLAEKLRLRDHNIRSWLLGLPIDDEAIAACKLDIENKHLMVLSIDSYMPKSKNYRREDAGLLQFAVHNVMKELFILHKLEGILVTIKHDVFTILIEPECSIELYWEQLKQTILELLGINMTLSKLSPAATESLNGALASFGGEVKQQEINHDHLTKSKKIQSDLMSYMLLGKTEQLREYLEQFVENVRKLHVHDAKLDGLGLALALVEISKKEFAQLVKKDTEIGEWIEDLQPFNSSDEVALWLSKLTHDFIWQLNSWLSDKNVNLLDKAIGYIELHYGGACSIHDVAGHIHLSVSYFSNLFKKETGDSYTNYLTKLRLEKAKILLSNTNMKISEIAESVGYEDPNYFTTVFRQWIHCSPSEYRKQQHPT